MQAKLTPIQIFIVLILNSAKKKQKKTTQQKKTKKNSQFTLKSLLLCLVKEKEDAHTDPEFQPMKDDDCTFVEYR